MIFNVGPQCLFDSEFRDVPCVYLWTIRRESDGAHLIHYIGEASAFAGRQREHLIRILGLDYGIYDVEGASRGEINLVWPGLWRDKSPTGPTLALSQYESMAPRVVAYAGAIAVFVAPLERDRDFRRQVEGSIARSLRTRHSKDCSLYPSDNRTGVTSEPMGVTLKISSDERIAGLDSVLEI